MRKILLLGALVFCTFSLIAQEQISNRMTISLEGSTTFDAEFTGGGLKIDRKINTNFSVGVFSSILVRNYPGVYYSFGNYSATGDNGDQVTYEFIGDSPSDTTNNGGYIYTDDWSNTSYELQVGLRLKYSLYTQMATRPYVGFNLSYNKQILIDESESESIIFNRLEKNNGLLTSFELGIDQDISNRFLFFINIRATLLTNLVQNQISLKKTNEELTEGIIIDNGNGSTTSYGGGRTKSATFLETLTEQKFPTFFGSIGISYKIF
jgi:hypothetical protein